MNGWMNTYITGTNSYRHKHALKNDTHVFFSPQKAVHWWINRLREINARKNFVPYII